MSDTNTGLALTTEAFAAAGITVQITQGDVIDVVAGELFDAMDARMKELNAEGLQLQIKLSAAIAPHAEKLRAKLPEPTLEGDVQQSMSYKILSGTTTLTPIHIAEVYNKDEKFVIQRRSGVLFPETDKKTVKLKITVNNYIKQEAEKDGKMRRMTEELSLTETVNVPIGAFRALAEEHQKQIEAVYQLFGTFQNGYFSADRIAREARKRLTRKMLTNQAPGVRENLNLLFGTKL